MRVVITTEGKVTTIDPPVGSTLEVLDPTTGHRLRYVEDEFIAGTLRDQLHQHRRLMRFVAVLVTAFLIGLFAILGFFDTERLSVLWTSPIGRVLLVAGGSLTAVYHWAIRRLEKVQAVQLTHLDSRAVAKRIAAHEREVLVLTGGFGLVAVLLLVAAASGALGR